MKYSLSKGLAKSLVQFALFSFPFIATLLPEVWMNLTVGAILTLIHNFLKVKAREAGMIE